MRGAPAPPPCSRCARGTASGLGSRASGFGFRVSGFGVRYSSPVAVFGGAKPFGAPAPPPCSRCAPGTASGFAFLALSQFICPALRVSRISGPVRFPKQFLHRIDGHVNLRKLGQPKCGRAPSHLLPFLSHAKCISRRSAEVNSPTNSSTYP